MRRNVALAILALSELEKSLGQQLLPADTAGALGNLFLPGRYQTVLTSPTWIFDTAHNPQALTTVLTEFMGRPGPGRKVVVFGAMQDKEVPVEMATLLAGCDALVGVPVSLPRSRTSAELRNLFQSWSREPVVWPPDPGQWPTATLAPDIRQAVLFLADRLEPNDSVLVTGSCFMVAESLYRLGFTDLEATRESLSARRVFEHIGED
jgi:folylpolyglutamate synthase/dihydropteroate synthase